MEQKLRSPEGRRRYLRRQASVEPVVGIIKRVLGFEQFSLRGLQKVALEWNLVCVAYNLKRLHQLLKPANQKPKAPKTPNPMPSAVGELLGQLFSHYCLAFLWICSAKRSLRSLTRGSQAFGLDAQATVQLRLQIRQAPGLGSQGPSGRAPGAPGVP